MHYNAHRLLLADDSVDVCLFFKEEREEIPDVALLAAVSDGIVLISETRTRASNTDFVVHAD